MLELLAIGGYLWMLKKAFAPLKTPSANDSLGYEHRCAVHLTRLGYQAELTPPSGDGNKDIVIFSGRKIVGYAECKYHARPIGAKEIKVLHATMLADNVPRGWFFSLNGFSSDAFRYIRKTGAKIEFVSGDM